MLSACLSNSLSKHESMEKAAHGYVRQNFLYSIFCIQSFVSSAFTARSASWISLLSFAFV